MDMLNLQKIEPSQYSLYLSLFGKEVTEYRSKIINDFSELNRILREKEIEKSLIKIDHAIVLSRAIGLIEIEISLANYLNTHRQNINEDVIKAVNNLPQIRDSMPIIGWYVIFIMTDGIEYDDEKMKELYRRIHKFEGDKILYDALVSIFVDIMKQATEGVKAEDMVFSHDTKLRCQIVISNELLEMFNLIISPAPTA